MEVDQWGDTLLRTLQAQGLPDVVSVVPHDSVLDAKARPGILKSLLSFMQYFVPSQARIYDLHVNPDRLNALRALAEGKPANVRWREGRTWILGESVSWQDGLLKVTGVVRGNSLSANRLIHLPNYGDFQIARVGSPLFYIQINNLHTTQIESAPLPRHSKSGASMEVEPTIFVEPDAEDADSLVSSNDPDDLANEQTWPTEEEMNEKHEGMVEESLPDASKGTTPKIVKRVPKGTSEYQAAWIIDESDDDEGDEETGETVEEMDASNMDEEEMEDLVMEDDDAEDNAPRPVDFHDLDEEEEERQ